MYRDGDLFFVVLFQIPMPFGNLAKRALGDACIKSFVMTKKNQGGNRHWADNCLGC